MKIYFKFLFIFETDKNPLKFLKKYSNLFTYLITNNKKKKDKIFHKTHLISRIHLYGNTYIIQISN